MTLSIPNTEFSRMIIGSVDLPNSMSDGKVILSDIGLDFIYLSTSYAVPYSLKYDMKTWKKDITIRLN